VSGSFDIRLAAARHGGDPAADAVVASFAALPGGTGWRLLDAALDAPKGSDPFGAPLDALIDPLREPPEWLDLDLADAGAVAYWRVGALTLFFTLTYGSLAFGYQTADLVRPLAATGRLEHMAARRIAETSRWVVAVTAPGGMHPGADGWRASIRARWHADRGLAAADARAALPRAEHRPRLADRGATRRRDVAPLDGRRDGRPPRGARGTAQPSRPAHAPCLPRPRRCPRHRTAGL
jgi:hypothetical protein